MLDSGLLEQYENPRIQPPCLPAHNECGVLIGALGQGCTMTATRDATWTAVKALY